MHVSHPSDEIGMETMIREFMSHSTNWDLALMVGCPVHVVY